ncbi:hypothetical protein [Dactylococcopsis salina]|uniref:hypothetical protein n=1 Tax=Dactylococcopsis salina TaxID=292566 RepID=UPI00031D6565|nr:hypothetical protein [Dactylococcopsis salina]
MTKFGFPKRSNEAFTLIIRIEDRPSRGIIVLLIIPETAQSRQVFSLDFFR